MAIGYNFPVGYQPYQQQPYQQQQQQLYQQPNSQQMMGQQYNFQQPQAQPQQPQNPMIWVQGEAGAKSYLLAPNTTLPLWDSEQQTVYIKSTDASGMPSMKVLDYTIRESGNAAFGRGTNALTRSAADDLDFVTHEELKQFEDKIAKMIGAENERYANDADDGAA